jgi:hypothetical protein
MYVCMYVGIYTSPTPKGASYVSSGLPDLHPRKELLIPVGKQPLRAVPLRE